MLLKVLNYTVRAIIVVVGILFFSGLIIPHGADESTFKLIGVICILFGLYRLAMYHTKQRRYDLYENDDEK